MRKITAKDINRKLQAVLTETRTAKKLTQVELAERLEKPQSYVSKYETGERKLTLGDFMTICAALNVDPKVIIGSL